MGILRLLTNTKAMNGNAISPKAALEAWDTFSADPRTLWVDVPQRSQELRINLKGVRNWKLKVSC